MPHARPRFHALCKMDRNNLIQGSYATIFALLLVDITYTFCHVLLLYNVIRNLTHIVMFASVQLDSVPRVQNLKVIGNKAPSFPTSKFFQKDLSEKLLDSTTQLQQWYDTTKNIIKYMVAEARRIEKLTMRDIRTYFSRILQPVQTEIGQQEQHTQEEPTHDTTYWNVMEPQKSPVLFPHPLSPKSPCRTIAFISS
jgi:hypothetical protein